MALVLAVLTAGAVLYATGQLRSSESAPRSLEEFERIIGTGTADGATWQAYGDALRVHKRFTHAAAAYQRALDLDPDRPQARFNEALSLGQANSPDKFFAFFAVLISREPKLAVDLLERPELAGLHEDSRWEPAAVLARGQAAD